MVRPCLALVGLLAALVVTTGGQSRQPSPAPAASRAATLRTPWGHPDLQGRWTNATLTPLERPADLGGKEFFTPPEASEYSKTAFEKYIAQAGFTEETALAGETTPEMWGEPRTIVPTLAPRSSSAPPAGCRRSRQRRGSVPSVTYNSNYEIVQTPTHVVIHVEMGEGFRVIPLDGRPHLRSGMRQWLGDSRGHWDGDTLVVNTANVSGKRELRGSGAGLQLVERFTRASDGMLLYQFTATDPSTWTTSWSAEVPMMRLDGLLYEYACHEGNRSLEYILRAARKAEN